MAQQSIKVEAASSGNDVDFSETGVTGNYRQAVTIGDPISDFSLAQVVNSALMVRVAAGTIENITGTVNATQSGVWVVNVNNSSITSALPAGSALIASVRAITTPDMSTVYNGVTAIVTTIQNIAVGSLGFSTLIGTVAGQRIKVLQMNFVVQSACAVYAVSGSNAAPIWGSSVRPLYFSATGGIVLPYNPNGYFQSASGEGILINLSTSVSIGGSVTYALI